MKLTLLSLHSISNLSLPDKPAGRYWLRARGQNGKLIDIIAVEAMRSSDKSIDDQWILKSNRKFNIVNKDGDAVQSVLLSDLQLYKIQSFDKKIKYTLFTEPLTDDRKIYNGYVLTNSTSVTIGSDEKNDICYSNRFVSREHAEIVFSDKGVFLKDSESTNNTYVNNVAVKSKKLAVGDVIYIMGLQIVVNRNGLFFNNPDGAVKVNTEKLCEFSAPVYKGNQSDEELEEYPKEYYYRAPRFKYDVDDYILKVDPPPSRYDNDEIPMVMMIGPSVTMGMASVASGIFTITNAIERGNISSAIPSLVMCISMLLGTLMWPVITKIYQKRQRAKKENKRQEKYKAYINGLELTLLHEKERQEQILRRNDVDVSNCVDRILSTPPHIWERTSKHTDFLSIRLGYGNLPLKAQIQYPERKFSVDNDNLTELLYDFGEKERFINKVPICLPLVERFISGIYGDKGILYHFARAFILQIVALHSYDEVKLVILHDESISDYFSFLRWLPHTMNNGRTARYVATNAEEVKELSLNLEPVIEYRKNFSENKLKEEKPYYVIISLDKELTTKAAFIRNVLEYKGNIGFSIVSFCEKLVDLPKECMAVAELNQNVGNMKLIDDVCEAPIQFKLDELRNINIQQVTQVLANTAIDISGTDYALPSKYTFFEMLDIGMVEHLNIQEKWNTNDPTKSLAVPVGVDKYGDLFKLDLHERAHGPHGLVAGMTGSGKSEFIISYILSMAVSFHPQEVAFILIDYKGGGMAKSFENLPHTAGIITNLDGNGIKRSLASLRSELHRRERIFRDVSDKSNISNIDIYKYQKLYRDGKANQPLPHLFIIADEFAELKKEQSDFMTELTSTARVGRSLGVHLILATQKPGGVVDEQIRSNSRFKVCLKVQDSSDSQEMLGRPEAAALVDTGRFYLQVGYNEMFEIGQSAWAGAPYYASQKTIKECDNTAVSVINTNGRIVAQVSTNRFANLVEPPKQLDVITGYIADYCRDEHIPRWRMWLEPISPFVYVDTLAKKYPQMQCNMFKLNPIVGEFDDPAHQRQDILRVPLTSEGNAIVYGSAGSGKAMFVEAMCYSLMREHTPQEVHIYILDFGSETLTAFSDSPFVGDVILSHETEKINNLFKLLAGKIETRKKLIARFGGNMLQYNQQAEKSEPNIVVIINNYAAFSELFEEKAGEMSYLTREGTKYGIYFVLTCTGVNNVRFNMQQNFKLLYCLQMNKADDYSSIVGKTDGFTPEKYKGRGVFRLDKDTLVEFQTASITTGEFPYIEIRSFCSKLFEKFSDYHALGVPVLPEEVTVQFLSPYIKPKELSVVPIGVEKNTLEISYFNFNSRVVNLVLSENNEWISFSCALCSMIAEKTRIKTYVLAPLSNWFCNMHGTNIKTGVDMVGCVDVINEIHSTILYRNNEYKDIISTGGEKPQYEPLFVVINSISALKTLLEHYVVREENKIASDDTPLNRLQIAMAKCTDEYNVHFLICENIGALTPFTAESWYKTHVNSGSGIWIGNGISSQFRLTINKRPKEYSAELASGFGFVIENATATLVKFLQ